MGTFVIFPRKEVRMNKANGSVGRVIMALGIALLTATAWTGCVGWVGGGGDGGDVVVSGPISGFSAAAMTGDAMCMGIAIADMKAVRRRTLPPAGTRKSGEPSNALDRKPVGQKQT